MKLPGKEGRVTPLQAATLDTIRKAGGKYGVATSYQECLEIINGGR